MARRTRRRPKRRNLSLVLLPALLGIGSAGTSEGSRVYLLSDLEVVREIAPMFPLHLGTGNSSKGTEQGRRLEDRDILERSKREWRRTEEVWPTGLASPEEASLTAIYDLTEGGGLGFEFVTNASGTYYLELETPRAPNLGAFAVRIGTAKAGILDAWAPRAEPLAWRRLPAAVKLSPGENRIDFIQLSPTDSPVLVRAFKLTPATLEEEIQPRRN